VNCVLFPFELGCWAWLGFDDCFGVFADTFGSFSFSLKLGGDFPVFSLLGSYTFLADKSFKVFCKIDALLAAKGAH